MQYEDIKKLTYKINALILFMVFFLMGGFALCKATFLVWFSIPTALVYVYGFYLIRNDRLGKYVRIVYLWLTLYMSLTTLFLGNKFGFHLYTMSMIPILFTTEYLAYKVKSRKIETTFYAILVVAMYMVSTIHATYIGPVYEVDTVYAGFFWFSNSLVVIGLLTYYARLLIRQIIESDKKQTERANTDFLTHLYNRHFMMKRLNEAYDDDKDHYIAMIDVDDFKKINDIYGHTAGDEVLKKIAEAMNDVCKDCKVSRWGGEEFLILTDEGSAPIEKLRKAIEDIRLEYEGQIINVTITAGVEEKDKSVALNKWIVAADEKLYQGKQNGKNTVVA